MITPTRVYLAGAITGYTAEEATDWREEAKQILAWDSNRGETGIVGFSPMRAKDYLRNVGVLSGRPEAYDDYVLSSSKGIMARDSWDVRQADLVYVYLLGTTKASIGTCMEIGMAYALNKPVVVCMENDNPHNHPMLNTAAGWITDDFEYSLDIVKAILLPDGVKVAY